jgi:hypothetical protein
MKTKRKQEGIQAGARPLSIAAPPRSRRGRILLVASALGLCTATWAFFEFVVWNRLPPELVGKWVVVEGPQEGATFDFFRNGTMTGRINLGGNEGIINARVRVEGKNIYSTTRHPETGQEDTVVQIIRRLTATELVVEDERGKLLKMERAR